MLTGGQSPPGDTAGKIPSALWASADALAGRLARRPSRVDPLARLRVARFAAHCHNSPRRLLVLGWPRIRRPHPAGRLIVGDSCAIAWRTHFDLHGPDAV